MLWEGAGMRSAPWGDSVPGLGRTYQKILQGSGLCPESWGIPTVLILHGGGQPENPNLPILPNSESSQLIGKYLLCSSRGSNTFYFILFFFPLPLISTSVLAVKAAISTHSYLF